MDEHATVTTYSVASQSSAPEPAAAVGTPSEILRPGTTVGRYVVMAHVGAGGMGRVYSAYDPELDRTVALKLLRAERDDEVGRGLLVGEARALAKLAHPHVVAVHDFGIVDEQVFVAMEYVSGTTLREVLKDAPPWKRVLPLFIDVAEGLAAIHAAGLVHRDLKPDNIMLGEDGRVRVMDFGLARAARPSLDPDHGATSSKRSSETESRSRTGSLHGTPAYLAPELWQGDPADDRTDQFAYCVSLWEALHGQRPFAARSASGLSDAMLAGRIQEPPSDRRVPRWLRQICERGLDPQPGRRFASMDALRTELVRGRARSRWRKGLLAAGVIALLGTGGEGWRRWETAQQVAACEASGAEVMLVWNGDRKQQLRAALVATAVSHASVTADKTIPWLDRHAAAWREARTEACLDANVRGRWDQATLERSSWCLDERRDELGSLVDELLQADSTVVDKAVSAAAALLSVAPCRDEQTLEVLGVPSAVDDPEGLARARAAVKRAANLDRLGRLEQGIEQAREALTQSQALGWRPVVASAQYVLGTLLEHAGAFAEAEEALEDAFFDATEGVAPEVAANAAAELVYVTGVDLGRPEDGRRWARHAEASLTRLSTRELARARLLSGLAALDKTTGAYDDALRLYQQALETAEEALGAGHPDLASTLSNLGVVHQSMGALDEAISMFERAIVVRTEALGPDHPRVAKTLNNLAAVRSAKGDYAGARELSQRALDIFQRSLGPEHPDVARALNDLAMLHASTGDTTEAMQLFERALVIQEQAFGPNHPFVASILVNLANTHLELRNFAKAIELYDRALAIQEQGLGPDHPKLAFLLTNLATLHHRSGDDAQARALYERALPIHERALGPDHPDVARTLHNLASVQSDPDAAALLYRRALDIYERALGRQHPDVARTLVDLAELALEQGRPTDALALAKESMGIWDRSGTSDHEDAVHTRFVLAQALWEAPEGAGRDRAEAMRLAEQARQGHHDGDRADERAEVERWLELHPDDSRPPAPP